MIFPFLFFLLKVFMLFEVSKISNKIYNYLCEEYHGDFDNDAFNLSVVLGVMQLF